MKTPISKRPKWKKRKALHRYKSRRKIKYPNHTGGGKFSRCHHRAIGVMTGKHLEHVDKISNMPAHTLRACARCGLVMSISGKWALPAARKAPRWLRRSSR